MQRLIFESSPAWIAVCLIAGGGYAWLLYSGSVPWGKTLNRLLFALRALLAFVLALLLLSPILRQITRLTEKPRVVILRDDSESIRQVLDSSRRTGLVSRVEEFRQALAGKGFEVMVQGLEEETSEAFVRRTSDLQGALRKTAEANEGRNVAAVVLVSDGIYNSGLSPLHSSYPFSVWTVGAGDTSSRADLAICGLTYNKIAYQGNRFPLRAEVLLRGYRDKQLELEVRQGEKVVSRQSVASGSREFVPVDFLLEASEKGLQRYEVRLAAEASEANRLNNRATAFVDVVEGRKSIVLISPAPHPDIKALRSVVEQNANYEFKLHIPTVQELPEEFWNTPKADLVVLFQCPDRKGITRDAVNRLGTAGAVLYCLGPDTDLRQLALTEVIGWEKTPLQWDDVTPVWDPSFSSWSVEKDLAVFSRYPPVSVPFGNAVFTTDVETVLRQRVGSLATEKPLLVVRNDAKSKRAVLLGNGIWRWRLAEYAENNNTEVFDEMMGKLIQYLATPDDRRRFRSNPVQNEFSDADVVVFDSQVYNELYEQVFGNIINLEVRNEIGETTKFSYITSPGSTRYRIGSLPEGVYRYSASTTVAGKPEMVTGQFQVVRQNIESQNLQADFGLLRSLSAQTGGRFYRLEQSEDMVQALATLEARSVIHSEEAYRPLINLKWVFFVLLAMVSVEWFVRKYFGGY